MIHSAATWPNVVCAVRRGTVVLYGLVCLHVVWGYEWIPFHAALIPCPHCLFHGPPQTLPH